MSGPFQLLSDDAPVGYGAGAVSARRIGIEQGSRLELRPPCSPLRPKNVATHVEIIAELLACHPGGRGFEPVAPARKIKNLRIFRFPSCNFLAGRVAASFSPFVLGLTRGSSRASSTTLTLQDLPDWTGKRAVRLGYCVRHIPRYVPRGSMPGKFLDRAGTAQILAEVQEPFS